MRIAIAYFTVFLLGAVPFLEATIVIPIAVAAGLHAFPVSIAAFLGNILTIWLLILLMDHVIGWMKKRRERKGKNISNKRQERAMRIWKKYGLPGFAILSPLLIGSHLGAFLAMTLGGSRRKITVWMTASVLGWTIVTGVLSHYGIDYLFNRMDREGFLQDFFE
jgi:uncharacterized membrane protein